MRSLHKYKLEQQELCNPLSFTAYIKKQIITLLCLCKLNFLIFFFCIKTINYIEGHKILMFVNCCLVLLLFSVQCSKTASDRLNS